MDEWGVGGSGACGVIFDANSPSASECYAVDYETGEEIGFLCRADTETGIIERGVAHNGGFIQIEERLDFRIYHRPTGQLICQHPR